jgi:hypothetical protein
VGREVVGAPLGVPTSGWKGERGDIVGEVGIVVGGLCVGDFGTSFSFQVPGISAIGNNQVAVRVTPWP